MSFAGAPLPTWARELVGRQFFPGALGPDPIDCWALVAEGLERGFGIVVPEHAGMRSKNRPTSARARDELEALHASAATAPDSPWVLVDGLERRPGDVLAFRGRYGLHVAVVAVDGWMVHAAPPRSRPERYARAPWPALLRSVYRHRSLA